MNNNIYSSQLTALDHLSLDDLLGTAPPVPPVSYEQYPTASKFPPIVDQSPATSSYVESNRNLSATFLGESSSSNIYRNENKKVTTTRDQQPSVTSRTVKRWRIGEERKERTQHTLH